MTPHLNHLNTSVLMRGHNICFPPEIRKIISDLSLLPPLICSSAYNINKIAYLTLENTNISKKHLITCKVYYSDKAIGNPPTVSLPLTLLHSEGQKLYGVLTILSTIGLKLPIPSLKLVEYHSTHTVSQYLVYFNLG